MASLRVPDLVGAIGACALLLAWTWTVGPAMPGGRELDAPAHLLAAVTALALAWRRRAPRLVLATSTVTTTTYLVLDYPFGPILLVFAVAVYTVARHLPWRTAASTALAALVILPLHILANENSLDGALGLGPATAWVAVPFAIGTTLAQRAESVTRVRREAIERGVREERLRVAQEVHDIVGHGLAAIKMQADVALHLLPTRPEYARTALEAVSGTSARALDELRSTLRMVRGATDSAPSAAHSSAPGLADLDALYRRMAQAGLRVRARATGTRAGLPPEADLAVYRVVQESLTNVLKHADRKEADIAIDHAPDGLRIRVTNSCPGSAAPPGGDGMGILGMRERLVSQGGWLTAGPEPSGQFVVQAWLPVRDRR